MKKTILHLIATNFMGGPEKQIINHLKRLDRDTYAPMVASFIENGQPNEFLEKAAEQQVKCHAIPMSNPIDFIALWKLNQTIRKEKIDLLCVHGYKSCVMGWLVAKMNQIPILAFSRGYTAENFKIILYQWFERRFLRHMDGVIAVSKGQLEKLEKIFKIKLKKAWVVYNAISVNGKSTETIVGKEREFILENLGLPLDSRIIVSAGRLSPEKGYQYLIEAISHLNFLDKDIYFVICGDGICMSDLKRYASSLGVADRILFAGFRRDISDIFRILEFMVLPSLTEGLPNVILESFAVKKPVVATSVGGVPELVEDSVNGILCPPSDSELLSKAIQKALSQKIQLAGMGLAGFKKIECEFSVEKQTKSLERIYGELLGYS